MRPAGRALNRRLGGENRNDRQRDTHAGQSQRSFGCQRAHAGTKCGGGCRVHGERPSVTNATDSSRRRESEASGKSRPRGHRWLLIIHHSPLRARRPGVAQGPDPKRRRQPEGRDSVGGGGVGQETGFYFETIYRVLVGFPSTMLLSGITAIVISLVYSGGRLPRPWS